MTAHHVCATLACLALVGWLAGAARLAPPDRVRQPAKATAGRFAVQDGGKTVLDRISGLRWQQAFSATNMNQAAAKNWCSANTPGLPGTGWRLPGVGELATLVERKPNSPAIDAAFAGTPAAWFWSSTPWVAGGAAWIVNFYDGGSALGAPSFPNRVRCVR